MSVRENTARVRGVTLYEIVAEGPRGEFLVAYSNHTSMSSMLRILRKHGGHAVKFFGVTENDRYEVRGGKITLGPWTVYASGRTELQAKTEGELPWWRTE